MHKFLRILRRRRIQRPDVVLKNLLARVCAVEGVLAAAEHEVENGARAPDVGEERIVGVCLPEDFGGDGVVRAAEMAHVLARVDLFAGDEEADADGEFCRGLASAAVPVDEDVVGGKTHVGDVVAVKVLQALEDLKEDDLFVVLVEFEIVIIVIVIFSCKC